MITFIGVRDGNDWEIYQNAVSEATATDSTSLGTRTTTTSSPNLYSQGSTDDQQRLGLPLIQYGLGKVGINQQD